MKKKYGLVAAGLALTLMFTGCGGAKSDAEMSYLSNAYITTEDSKMAMDVAYVDGGFDPFEIPGFEDGYNTDEYQTIKENSFLKVSQNPLSTFAADVDTGTYCNLRRLINEKASLDNISNAIRTEEMINYFDYEVSENSGIFGLSYNIGACPWNEDNKLLVLTLQANAEENIPEKGNNFVFLVDTSGSMMGEDRLELAVKAFKILAETVTKNDRFSVVTYSGSWDVLIDGSNDYKKIIKALDKLEAGGCTNGSGGITAAYECARKNFIEGGNNRVILASDGDMNLGITSTAGLTELVEKEKESGVFLTTLGFGYGNFSDANMESIADSGNGNYYYIDCLDEAKRVLWEKLSQTTVTVAKDVKFQIEFNPAVVSSYRQIGYENRQMAASDFDDDKKDGGEMGAGQQITIAYELVMADGSEDNTGNLKYQDSSLSEKAASGEICTVSARYKAPDKDVSEKTDFVVTDTGVKNEENFNFVAGIIEVSMLLRDSEYKGNSTYDKAYKLVKSGMGSNSYRKEFAELIKKIEKEEDV
ncbi:MAG: von Willebrand factor type A domain-containing protein [Lachnospiraceae bacterium]|nr:von Willebrand factor type A domain-containing protein [Lachnospiraceae bacterium]